MSRILLSLVALLCSTVCEASIFRYESSSASGYFHHYGDYHHSFNMMMGTGQLFVTLDTSQQQLEVTGRLNVTGLVEHLNGAPAPSYLYSEWMDVHVVRVFDEYCSVNPDTGAMGLSGGPTLLSADFSFVDGTVFHPAVGNSPLRNVGGIDNPSLNLYGTHTIWNSWPDGVGSYPIELGLTMQLQLVPEPTTLAALGLGAALVRRQRSNG